MASITREKRNGKTYYKVQFYNKDKARKSIRLGTIKKKAAEAIKAKVEVLVSCSISGGSLDNETAKWLMELGDDLRAKLERQGLIPSTHAGNGKADSTLGGFLKAYIAGRSGLSENTQRNYAVTQKHLTEFFGEEQPLADVKPGDADDWRENLIGKGLSGATISREVKRARQYFRAAKRKGLIKSNPFDGLPAPQQVNKEREFFVKPEVIEKVIGACPDAEWKLIVALSRYGGLRCPSEHLSLRWNDVDWESQRVTIRSPNTEHLPDGASRVIPLFPELKPYLEAVKDNAAEGARHVITRYRDRNSNLRTQFLRIIERAGQEAWPRLFQNLRASRETELMERFPAHVVCAWIGNSEAVAKKHYLQVTDEHFQRGASGG